MHTLAHYRIIQQLGQGATGTVYLAEDTRNHQQVALKVLHPELAVDPKFRQAFQNEAEFLLQLSHPNLIRIYESGQDENRWYIAMQYLPGGTLAQKLREHGGLSFAAAIKTATQICEGLQQLHQNNLVHRDIKPENIFYHADGHVVIGDFGMARSATASRSTLHRTNKGLGTPRYIAPEIWNEEQYIGPPADIYALGCVLYEMFTARPLFPARSLPQAVTMHTSKPPDWGKNWLPPQAPVTFTSFIETLVAKDPSQRPQNAGALLPQLRNFSRETGFFATATYPKQEIESKTPQLQIKRLDLPSTPLILPGKQTITLQKISTKPFEMGASTTTQDAAPNEKPATILTLPYQYALSPSVTT